MIGSFLNIFKIPDLRRKIFITLALCVAYRLGAHVPTPFIDPSRMTEYFKSIGGGSGQGGVFAVVDMFSGGAFKNMTIFALGIMPYISSSIILQLLTVVWPRLEKISKEGEAGRKKINQYTRYGTVVLALFQGMGIGVFLRNQNLTLLPNHPVWFLMTTAITLAAGTSFIMWLGEKITEHGIGNGISLITAIGIIAGYPYSIGQGIVHIQGGASPILFVLVIAAMIFFSGLTVLTQQASRKIPVQHARRMVGRKIMQGGSNFLPLKLNTAGVIPVIFSSALLSFPQMIFGNMFPGSVGRFFSDWLGQTSNKNLYELFSLERGGIFSLLRVVNVWTISYIVLTMFFCYFYTALTFNPVDLAENLKKSGAFIPGRKPGKPTSDYINYILVRITIVGGLFLIAIALVPDVFFVSFHVPYAFASIAGGTGLIIVVGVVLDTMKQIESQLLMRHYEGFSYKSSGGAATRRRLRR
ncbi:preprotein translocase subunit SecY [Candidatus Sumerlaeota bacterium]|nr:preprotein translocase subunit SecY [Candidatus Sumerlaeota bacterium]